MTAKQTPPSAFDTTQAEIDQKKPPSGGSQPPPSTPTPPSGFDTTQEEIDNAPATGDGSATKEDKNGDGEFNLRDIVTPFALTALVAQQLKQNNYMPAPGDLTLTLASDLANGNTVPCTGQEILLIYNSDSALHHFTITSAPDHLGRVGDISNYIIGPTALCAIKLSQISGWQQPDGTIHVSVDNALVKFSVIR